MSTRQKLLFCVYHMILTHNGQSVIWAGLRGTWKGHSWSSRMCSPIHEGPYPGPFGIRACTAAHVSVWAHALQGPRQMGGATAMPPPQDFRKLWLSHKYRQTHNLLIIHLELFAKRLRETIWDIFRALPDASWMPPRCLPDASWMPPRCFLDRLIIYS